MHIHLLDKKDYRIKDSSIPNAGKGIFCKKDIPAGTIIMYNTIVKKNLELPEDEDPTYYMATSYIENGKDKTLRNFITDGNPKYFKGKKKHLATAAYVNEASEFPPNCVFVTNPTITKEDIIESYKNKRVLQACLLIVPFEVKKGEELFTMYGSHYDHRNYKQWRDRKGLKTKLIDEAHRLSTDHSREVEWLLFNQ